MYHGLDYLGHRILWTVGVTWEILTPEYTMFDVHFTLSDLWWAFLTEVKWVSCPCRKFRLLPNTPVRVFASAVENACLLIWWVAIGCHPHALSTGNLGVLVVRLHYTNCKYPHSQYMWLTWLNFTLVPIWLYKADILACNTFDHHETECRVFL